MRYVLKSERTGLFWNWKEKKWFDSPSNATKYRKMSLVRFIARGKLKRSSYEPITFAKTQGLKVNMTVTSFRRRN